ncbi:hypothetical protein STAS_23771 [Striga asiatica]|uniref:Uncharacterized protein n=1 Tax=Striga asiatica TaxID=4170 RepID=A0A5A7QS19_STRAF|nr:hypothetical protein STAS_23771 [Striga asiatica]
MGEQNSSTPKLSLSKLPCKQREAKQQIMLTPPIQSHVSVPFRWEEAPGKPRPATTERRPAAARCLDLPPRLVVDEAKITIMPSPETVLDGPYVGRSLSLACTFSFRKVAVAGGREEGLGHRSFREMEGSSGRGTFVISHTLGEMFKSERNVRVTRVRRRRSFFNLATVNSNFLCGWTFVGASSMLFHGGEEDDEVRAQIWVDPIVFY